MKKKLTTLILFGSALVMNAQWNGTTTTSNVGIGSTEPSTKLEIVGSSQIEYDLGSLKLKSATANQFLYMGYDDSYSAGYIQSIKPGITHQNILLAPKGGNIGIGLTNPDRKLTVAGEIGLFNGGVVFRTNTSLWDISSRENDLAFNETGKTTLLFLQSGGNIGIGTTAPSAKLDVCGTIRAQEIKVNMLSGCDFVFKDDYKLMNLNDLEKFIKTNQHLPEVASEKEMIENGVNMKEFQMKLLQKIEELTLYTIEQNKKIESLERIVMKTKSKSKNKQ